MTPKEAITRLREMQSQIIHGKNTFGDIADALVNENAELHTELQKCLADAVRSVLEIRDLLNPGGNLSVKDAAEELVKDGWRLQWLEEHPMLIGITNSGEWQAAFQDGKNTGKGIQAKTLRELINKLAEHQNVESSDEATLDNRKQNAATTPHSLR